MFRQVFFPGAGRASGKGKAVPIPRLFPGNWDSFLAGRWVGPENNHCLGGSIRSVLPVNLKIEGGVLLVPEAEIRVPAVVEEHIGKALVQTAIVIIHVVQVLPADAEQGGVEALHRDLAPGKPGGDVELPVSAPAHPEEA